MIRRILTEPNSDEAWVLQPTRSMSWREAKILVGVVTACSLAIGFWFLYQGYPFVLPFSGLEALAVALAFYFVLSAGEVREVITVEQAQIVVERGRDKALERAVFDRAWVKVELARSPRGWYPNRLQIRSHGRIAELGKFLTNGEREALAEALINAIEKNR